MANTYPVTLTLEDGNFFLTYPRDMMEDVNDKYLGAIADYEIDGNDLTLTITEDGRNHLEDIKKLIAEVV